VYSLPLPKLPLTVAAAGLVLPLLPQSPQSSAGLLLPVLPAAPPSAELLLFLLLLPRLTCTAEGGGGVKGRPSAWAFTFSR
jgi:hypothetical protein